MVHSKGILSKTLKLAAVGGAAFWVTTVAFSLLPIAAEYRRALSISYLPMLFQSVAGGLVIGGCIGYLLLRFFKKIPTKHPIPKSLIMSVAALALSLILIQVGASRTDNASHVFLIGALLNVPRFLVLGAVIGYVHDRLNRDA